MAITNLKEMPMGIYQDFKGVITRDLNGMYLEWFDKDILKDKTDKEIKDFATGNLIEILRLVDEYQVAWKLKMTAIQHLDLGKIIVNDIEEQEVELKKYRDELQEL